MTYDPKQRPVFLGTEMNRTNPNRLSVSAGVISVADANENNIVPIPQPPSLGSKLMAAGKVVALVLSALAGSLIAAQAGGLVLPGWLLGLCSAVLAIAAPLGIASGGIAKPAPKP